MAQLILLEPLPEIVKQAQGGGGGVGGWSPMCVVNTHLFGHPDATHVRLFQVGGMTRLFVA